MAKSKRCIGCGEQKSFVAFDKHPMGKNGLNPRCKKCRSIDAKKYGQTEQGKRTHRKASKKWRRMHKIECIKRNKEYRDTIIGYLRNRFLDMKRRCTDSKQECYKNYGGRGIKCLFKSSDEFVNYVIDVLKVDPRGLTIDRIDNDGNYEKGNIRFVTRIENNRNKRKKLSQSQVSVFKKCPKKFNYGDKK